MEITPAPAAVKDSVVAQASPDPLPVDKGLRWVTSILLLIFPTATLFVNRGDSVVFGLLILIGIWVWLRDGARRWLDRPTAWLWIAFVLFFAVALLSYLVGTETDAGFRFLGRYLRFLLIVPVYLALRRYPPTANTVFIGLALGSLASGILAGLQFLHANTPIRVQAATGLSIIFGDLVTTMVLCTVAGFGLMAMSRRSWVIPLLVLCLAGGIAATLLSGTRGAWLPLLLLIPALTTPAAGFLKRRHLFVIVAVFITIFCSFYVVARTDTHGRIKQAFQSTKNYFLARRALVGDFPHCDAQKAFLTAWSDFYYFMNNRPPLGLSVVKDPSVAHTGLCRGEYAVRLQNNSRTKWAGYAFPRVLKEKADAQSSMVLVRGTGLFTLGQSERSKIHFDSPGYVQVALKDADWGGEIIRIYIPPGKTAWLLPVDGYYGEYTLAIANTSVGQRLEMWRAAWTMFLQHPFWGIGTGAFQQTINRFIKDGKAASFVRDYDHPHNDYLNALAGSGIVGFAVLIAILFLPLRRFWHAVNSPARVTHAVGMAGVLSVIGFAIYALTDTIFLHSMMITWYVVYMALFYALLSAKAGMQAKPDRSDK